MGKDVHMSIYTITLNPAYDLHAYIEKFTPYCENLAYVQSRDAGGKGVNISRALRTFGITNTAVIVLGNENSGDYKTELQKLNMDCILIERQGRIRENLTIHCANAPETRISFCGFELDNGILDEILEQLKLDPNSIVTFTGRIPEGIQVDAVKAFLNNIQKQGVRIVLDSKSFSLKDIYEIKPWLIKPNQEELSEYFGCRISSIEEALDKALEFAKNGVVNVMISLGEQGALLVTDNQCFASKPPSVQVESTIGAGDSSIAGFIAGTMQSKDPDKWLQLATAFGSAACLTAGSKPPDKTAVEQICKQVRVCRL